MYRPSFLFLLPLLACGDGFRAGKDGPALDSGADDTGDPDDTGDAEPSIVFTSPGEYAENPVDFAVAVGGPIVRVEYWLEDDATGDETLLVQSADAAAGFASRYSFDVLGSFKVEARGFDVANGQVADARVRFRLTDLNRENDLGVWLEGLGGTGYDTHADLAARLAPLGVKRVFLKVADGSADCEVWPDNCDPDVPAAWHAAGIQVWAWSVVRPRDADIQALALTLAADTGYDGYVVHLAPEWADQTAGFDAVFQAFKRELDESITADRVPDAWELRASIPADAAEAGWDLAALDGWVTAVHPRLEEAEAAADPAGAVEAARCALRDGGLTVPLHPMVDTTGGSLGAAGLDALFAAAGREGSAWKVPAADDLGGTWATWEAADWNVAAFATPDCP